MSFLSGFLEGFTDEFFKNKEYYNKCSYCRSRNSFVNGNCKNCGGPEEE
jgi:hypothetical protein